MKEITRQEVYLILGIIIALLIIFRIIKAIADSYIKNNRETLAEENQYSEKCKKSADKLIRENSTFLSYIADLQINQVYACSSSIVNGASKDPVKYVIKYSNIENTITDLEKIDFCISYEKTIDKYLSRIERVRAEALPTLPFWVRLFSTKEKIPYSICDIKKSDIKTGIPTFRFSYTSPAGKSGRSYSINITSGVLEEIRNTINKKIEKQGHSRAQRASMSNDLREAIKRRDNYTCCICGNSVFKEPNLLLEVDHITPISKGGKTEANNLQTLCWRCNRAKSNNV